MTKTDSVLSGSPFLKSAPPSSISPNRLKQFATQACNYRTFFKGNVSISIMYSSRVSSVSYTMRHIQPRHSLGNFFMFWPRIRLSIIVMALRSGFRGIVFLRSSWSCWLDWRDIVCGTYRDSYLKSVGYFCFYIFIYFILPFSVLISVVRYPYKSAASLYTPEDFGQNPYILMKRSFISKRRS